LPVSTLSYILEVKRGGEDEEIDPGAFESR
jgi:hypothetical protein